MSLNCIYKTQTDNKTSKLYETLKSYFKEDFEGEENIRSLEDEVEFKAEQVYHWIHSDEFKNWFGRDWIQDYFGDKELAGKYTNEQGEPTLYRTYGGELYFINTKGARHIITNSNFGNLSTEDISQITDQLMHEVSSKLKLRNINSSDIETVDIDDIVENFINDIIENNPEDDSVWEGIYLLNLYRDDFVNNIKSKFEEISISFQQVNNNTDEVLEDEIDTTGVVKVESVNVNSKDKARSNIKLLLNFSVPKTTIVDNEVVNLKGKYFGRPLFENFDHVFKMLEPLLVNHFIYYESGEIKDPFNEMINTISNLSLGIPQFKNLLKELNNLDEHEQKQFWNAFQNTKRTFSTNLFTSRTTSDGTVSFTLKNVNESGTEPEKAILEDWGNNLRNTNHIVNNKIIINNVIEKYENFLKGSREKEDFIEILNEIGINISLLGLTASKNYEQSIADLASVLGILNNRPLLNANNNFNNPFLKEGTVKKFTWNLAEGEKFVRTTMGENTSVGAEGKKIWNYGLPTFIDLVVQQAKNDDYTHLTSLLESGYIHSYDENTTSSLLYNKLIEDPESINIQTFISLREMANNDSGVDNKGINLFDDIIVTISRTLQSKKSKGKSIMNMLTPGDKGRNLLIEGLDLIPSHYNSINPSLGLDALNTLRRYLEDELALLSKEHNQVYFKRNKGKLFLFPELSFSENRNEIQEILWDEDGNPTKGILDKDIPKINEYINKRFSDLVKNNYTELKSLLGEIIIDKSLNYPDEVEAIADFTLNSIIANVEMTKVFTGAPHFYKNLKDFFKRVPATYTDGLAVYPTEKYFNVSVIENVEISQEDIISEENINNIYEIEQSLGRPTTKSEIKQALEYYSENNITDAQAWITPQRWRYLQSNNWSEKKEKIYQKILKSEPLSVEELKITTQPIKGVHFQNTNGIPIYLKYSQAVLIPSLIKNTGLENLYNSMIKSKSDEVVVVDGIKVGHSEVTKIHDDSGKILNSFELKPMQLENRFWKLQQDLTSKKIKQGTLASQIQRNIISNIEKKGIYTIGDREVTGSELIDELSEVISGILEFGYDKLKGDLFKNGNFNDNKLRDLILRELGNDNPNVSEAIKRDIDLDSLPAVKETVQNVLSSYFKKNLIEASINQGAMIQVSNFGTFDLKSSVKEGITLLKDVDELKPPVLKKDENGKMVVTKGQVMIPSWMIAEHIPNYKELHSKGELLPMLDERIFNVIGYRIPNQGMSSNDALEVVGILPPEAGDTAIVYTGLTTKTGSDFDIDKMYMIFPNIMPVYNINKKLKNYIFEHLKGATRQDTIDNIDKTINQINPDYNFDMSKEDLVNELFSLDINNIEEFEKSVFRDTIQSFIEAVKTSKKKSPLLNYIKEQSNLDRVEKLVYVEGNSKKGLQNKLLELYNSVLTSPNTYYDLVSPIDKETKPTKEFTENNFPEDKSMFDGMGIYNPLYQLMLKGGLQEGKGGVGSTADNLVNVPLTQIYDMVLNDIFSLNNIYSGKNKVTGMLSGFLNAFVDIAKDDYILRSNVNLQTSPVVFLLLRSGKSIDWTLSLISNPVVKDIVKANNLKDSKIIKSRESYELPDIEYEGDVLQDVLNMSLSELQELLNTRNELTDYMIGSAYLALKKNSKYLGDFIRSTKYEVNGAGNTVVKHIVSLNKVLNVIEGISGYDKFSLSNVERVFKRDTVTGKRFHQGVVELLNIEKELFYEASNLEVLNALSRVFKGTNLIDEKLGKELSDIMYAYMFKNTNISLANTSELFDNTIYDKVTELKKLYRDNKFLQSLQPKLIDGKYFVEINNLKNLTKSEKYEVTLGWRELIESSDESESKLGKDLVNLSFFQSGFRPGFGTFYEFIPNDYMINSGLDSQIKNFKTNKSSPEFVEDIMDTYARNNWDSLSYIPKDSTYVKEAIQSLSDKTINKPGVKFVINGRGYYKGKLDNDVVYKKVGSKWLTDVNRLDVYLPMSRLGFFVKDPETGNAVKSAARIFEFNNLKSGLNEFPKVGKTIFNEETYNSYLDNITNSEFNPINYTVEKSDLLDKVENIIYNSKDYNIDNISDDEAQDRAEKC